jgi:DNA (cytosine-5)-methyltransferase 1
MATRARRSAMPLRTIDLFSGCGGLSLGFANAGFEIVAAYDNWELARRVYQANFQHDHHLFDLGNPQRAAAHIREYKPDCIIGGPPCQDFSIAGKRVESGRASLTVAFAKTVQLVRPRLMVMENVYNIEKSKSLETARAILRAAGYGLTSRVIDASYAGVPQMRRRYFLLGLQGAPDDFLGSRLDSGLSDEPMTVADHFGGRLGIQHYYAHPRSYKRRAVFSIHEPSATIRRVNRPIPASYVRHPADKAAVSPRVRALTTSERAEIQTFPRHFVFLGSPSQQEHLIANAVPVKLAEYVARCVLEGLQSHGRHSVVSPRERPRPVRAEKNRV